MLTCRSTFLGKHHMRTLSAILMAKPAWSPRTRFVRWICISSTMSETLQSAQGPTKLMQRAGANRFAQRKIQNHRRVAPFADLDVRLGEIADVSQSGFEPTGQHPYSATELKNRD